jgi:hypothetical protein
MLWSSDMTPNSLVDRYQHLKGTISAQRWSQYVPLICSYPPTRLQCYNTEDHNMKVNIVYCPPDLDVLVNLDRMTFTLMRGQIVTWHTLGDCSALS